LCKAILKWLAQASEQASEVNEMGNDLCLYLCMVLDIRVEAAREMELLISLQRTIRSPDVRETRAAQIYALSDFIERAHDDLMEEMRPQWESE